jgi:hypothetical protein
VLPRGVRADAHHHARGWAAEQREPKIDHLPLGHDEGHDKLDAVREATGPGEPRRLNLLAVLQISKDAVQYLQDVRV